MVREKTSADYLFSLFLAPNERIHTFNFYDEVVANQIMHYGCVNEKLYVGSCPRTLEHIENELGKELGITAVLSLQVQNDIEQNCKAILGDDHVPAANKEYDLASVDILRKAYDQAGILFLWVPITDFSSIGKELMSPQATLVLKTVLEKGHKVYVHCNAGKEKLSRKNILLLSLFRCWSSIWYCLCLSSFCIENSITSSAI